jgi:cyanophycinase-like exopeptidase
MVVLQQDHQQDPRFPPLPTEEEEREDDVTMELGTDDEEEEEENAAAYNTGTKAFRDLGCQIERFMVAKNSTTPSFPEMRRIIVEWADLIVVSGGNSLFAMLRWRTTGLDQLIKEAALKGTVLCGGSAGCGCWFDSMQTDSLKPEACKLSEKVLAELSPEQTLCSNQLHGFY